MQSFTHFTKFLLGLALLMVVGLSAALVTDACLAAEQASLEVAAIEHGFPDALANFWCKLF